MTLGRGIGFGLAAAAAAVGIWLTLSWLTGMTLILLAIVVAGCIGAGVGIGNGGRGGRAAGLAAGAIAVCAALVGRFYAVQFAFIADAKERAAEVGAEDVIRSFAEHAAENGDADGEEGDSAWAIAEGQWNRMPESQQQEYIAALRQHEMAEAGKMDLGVGLLLSVLTLRVFDFVCIGLAASTAYGTASRKLKDGPGEDPVMQNLKPGQSMVLEETSAEMAGPFAHLGREEKDRKAA